MPWIELERTLVVLEGKVELPSVSIRMAKIVLDVGVARVAERGGGKRLDRRLPVLVLDGALPAA